MAFIILRVRVHYTWKLSFSRKMRPSKTLEERGSKRASTAPGMCDVEREKFDLAYIHKFLQESDEKTKEENLVTANIYKQVDSCE